MFRLNCRAIFRLIFEQVECTISNAFHLRDLVLEELVKIITVCHIQKMPVPVAARSKAWVCGRSPAEIVGSNTAGGMDVCLL